MYIFLKRLFFFILLLVAVDCLFGFGLRQLYFGQKKGQFAQTTYSADSANQDILVFGSSRAVRHYSPVILSDSFHLSCYNVGRDAQMIPYCTALQEVIFNRHKPKMVILDINAWEFVKGTTKYEKLSILQPYCKKHPELVPYLAIVDPIEKWKLYSNVYPYNSTLFIALNNMLFANKIPKDEFGFAPLDKKMSAEEVAYAKKILALNEENSKKAPLKIDTLAFRLYKQFLQTCAYNHIPTYVVISPTLAPEHTTDRREQIELIAKTYPNVTFLDFSSDTAYNGHFEKFADVFHLNKGGAEEFTRELVGRMK
ncbi:hypothetical protein [Parasediminibacterium sp. JCM 36343]|uniref:hypothetical protein n=1 Tax=Parasediminibacterium sp. JCM 36343 TaxID=3374279 RepID=UPI00397938A6